MVSGMFGKKWWKVRRFVVIKEKIIVLKIG